MIRMKERNGDTVAGLMEEALAQIPLYTDEWTNFNASEPGITILEQLSGASVLQQMFISRMIFQVQDKLLAVLGFEAMDSSCARVLLKADRIKEDFVLPANQKFRVGETVFETNRQIMVSASNLVCVYSRQGTKLKSCGNVLQRENSLPEEIFGKDPKVQYEIYFLFDKPLPKGQDYFAYMRTSHEFQRNKPESGIQNKLAGIEWEYYTTEGFVTISCWDDTFCLLTDGELRFLIPDKDAAVYDGLPEKGYVLRGTLKEARYDLSPKLMYVCFGLFEVWQKSTSSICHTFPGGSRVGLYCDLLEEGYLQVFCREREGESYRLYRESEEETEGRYYSKIKYGYGMYEIRFSPKQCRYGPADIPDAVKIVAYDEEMMRRYDLGCVYGYDDQIVLLPVKNIVPEYFSVIARRKDEEGEYLYDFVRPGSSGEGDLYYVLLEEEGKLCIKNAGNLLEARLFICSCCVTMGEEGNIRPDNRLEPVFCETEALFWNPAGGSGGRLKESIAQVRQRFRADLHKPYAAVRIKDYETIVMETPGLCIHKAKAFPDDMGNQVNIVVKPYSYEAFPGLSPFYQEAIAAHLEQYKLLSTAFKIIQPVYVPVDAVGTIYVKKHYERCREQIEAVINKKLDYVHGEQNFGDLLCFSEVFRKIEELECVEFIYDLAFYSSNTQYAVRTGMDIKPGKACLCYPGKLYLEINTYMK